MGVVLMWARSLVMGSFLYAFGACALAATLQQLTIEEMAQKSTEIVRGRVGSCVGEVRGPVIYTRCRISATEHWKGAPGATLELVIPGGTAGGFTQKFTGTPVLGPGQEYVFFLWAGRSGMNQILGLSQGLFELGADGKTGVQAKREASHELMLGPDGSPVSDTTVRMGVSELRTRVAKALGEVK